MEKIKAKAYIKLGTSVRYLKDVLYMISAEDTAPEPLGGEHVIDNIKIVLDLIKQLDLQGTLSSGAYKRLSQLLNRLQEANNSSTHISLFDARSLHEVAKELRLALLAEGDSQLVYRLSGADIEMLSSGAWPERLTIEHVRRMPLGLVGWLLAALATSFGFGITFSEMGVTKRFLQAVGAESPTGDSAAGPTAPLDTVGR